MMPMYVNSSHPPHGHYHQVSGNYPRNMTMDASSPVSCEHWPAPSPCYGSCIHGNFPAYNAYLPPCYPPQVPFHPCCMNYSGFHPHASPYHIHQPFPAGYQPWYDSEKDMPGKHRCTKCSPDMCYPKNDSSVEIDEHEPEIEKGDHSESVKHVQSTNCPYPIIWIPHGNTRNQENGSSTVSERHDQPPAEVKAPESSKLQKSDPKSRNGCFPFDDEALKSLTQNQDWKKMQNGKTVGLPFDISKLKSLLQGQERKEVHMQKNKEPGQFPYPIVWIPSHGKQGDVEASENKERSNEGRNMKSFPSDHGGQTAQQKGEVGNFESKVLSDEEKESSMRNIPVENHLQEPRKIPVRLLEDHLPKPTEATKSAAKTEPVEKTKKEQPSSPPKASRLPPVCLRVDPLPKRKNGGSKSLSPPRRKEKPLTSEETKVVSPLSSEKAETRNVADACDVKCEEANKEMKMSEGRLDETDTEKESVESKSNVQEGANCEIVKPCETKENREKTAKKTFTEEEAARIIQSVYRGYDVRRWEPMKKLKEIASVREQMGDVKKRVQGLEASTGQRIEEKEILILGEMVMSLLLKLDSVQGLHLSIRDFRKSLARELSDIQEKLDSMKKSSANAEEKVVKEQLEISSQTSDSLVNLERTQPAEENTMISKSNTENDFPSSEEHSRSLMDITDEQLAAEAEEGTGLFETSATEPEPGTETGRCEALATSTTIPEKIEEVENVLPVNPLSTDGNGMTVTNGEEDNPVVGNLEEPPQVVETATGFEGLEDATGVSEPEENVDRKENDDTILPSEKEEVELSELPVGVIDDGMQLLSQDSSSSSSSSCTREVEKTAAEAETASQEETSVDLSSDCSKGIGQEISEPREEEEQSPETEVVVKEKPIDESEVIEHEIPEETKELMEENRRFKETMETLVKAGREQLEVISKLTGRVKSLEKKLSQKKRTQVGRRKPCRGKHVTKPISASSTDVVL